MAGHTITAAEIRYRLTDLTAVEVKDLQLDSAAFIGAADAWASIILSTNSTDVDSITEYQLALLKAAKIAFVCKRLMVKTLREDFTAGLVKSKSVTAAQIKANVDILKDEIAECLNICGWVEVDPGVEYIGGDDYHPSGTNLTQTDFEDHDRKPFSLGGG